MKKILITGGSGYIGSRLKTFLEKSNEVTILDTGIFSSTSNPASDYAINCGNFTRHDVIIHLASHCSVQFCDADPEGSLENNCINFIKLLKQIRPYQKLIYASSASVYGNSAKEFPIDLVSEQLRFNLIKNYDHQKQLIDDISSLTNIKYYGLRFGTVCGYSPNPRNELLINSMVKSAVLNKEINCTGANQFRAVLGLSDLCEVVQQVVDKDVSPGIYNIASFNASIGEIAQKVASYLNVPANISVEGGNEYSFKVSTTKIEKTLKFKFLATIESIIEECKNNDFTITRNWDEGREKYHGLWSKVE